MMRERFKFLAQACKEAYEEMKKDNWLWTVIGFFVMTFGGIAMLVQAVKVFVYRWDNPDFTIVRCWQENPNLFLEMILYMGITLAGLKLIEWVSNKSTERTRYEAMVRRKEEERRKLEEKNRQSIHGKDKE